MFMLGQHMCKTKYHKAIITLTMTIDFIILYVNWDSIVARLRISVRVFRSMLVDADIYNILLALLTSPPISALLPYMPITYIGILSSLHYWHFSFDFRYNMEKFAGQPIDTLADSRRYVDIPFWYRREPE